MSGHDRHLWRTATLGELIRIKHGYAFKSRFFSGTGQYILLTPGNFGEKGGLKLKGDKEKYYTGDVPDGYILKTGDLLVVMTEQAEGLLGSPASIPEGNRYLHNQRLGLVSILDPGVVDLRYVYYLFNFRSVRAQIRATANGAKVRHTSPSRIYEVKVAIPPLLTQRKIAAILSAYDDLIEKNARRIQIIELIATTLYREWFVRRYQSGRLPRGWKFEKLSELVEIQKGRKPKSITESHQNGLVPYLLLDGIEGGMQQYTSTENMVLVELDDVVMVMDGARSGVVFSGLFGAAGSTLARIRSLEKETFSPFLLMLTLQDRQAEIQAKNVGAAIPHANTEYLRVMEVVVATADVNREFHSQCEQLYALQRNLVSKNANLCRTRDLLLPRLISGEIDVSDLDVAGGGAR